MKEKYATALLVCFAAIISIWRFSFTAEGLFIFLWLCILIRIAVTDLLSMHIPDRYIFCLFAVSGLSLFVLPDAAPGDRLLGFVSVSLPMVLADLLVPGGFGGGDIKLMAAAGFFLGWRKNLLAAALGLLAAGIYSGYLLASRRAGLKDAFALGPFLCGGISTALVARDQLVIKYPLL